MMGLGGWGQKEERGVHGDAAASISHKLQLQL